MRWIYYNPDPAEEARRAEVVAKIDAWWRAFEAKADDLRAMFRSGADWDLPGWMDAHLKPIDPQIMWEYGPAESGDGHRLVLTPESSYRLRPLVAETLRRAPSVEGWEFHDARLPEGLELAKSTVEARASRDVGDFVVQVSISDNRLVDLCYYSPSIAGMDDEGAFHAAFVATESLLGERRMERWVGVIETSPFPEASSLRTVGGRQVPRHAIGLDRLRETVDAAVESLRDQLPPSPHLEWAEEAEWTLWELKPEPAEDYPRQADLFVAKSPNPPLWVAAHSGGPFFSERFSRSGETFCYVKIDGAEGLGDSSFADKGEIEDAIDEVLIPRGLGCQVGGGMGRRYAYVDLALVDVPGAIQAVRDRLREGGIPRRSWILFFDADLADEWVGIFDDTPPPPGIDAD